MAPHRNVELKARDADPDRTLRAALELGAQDHGILEQRDTYFAAREGRLKLREQLAAGERRAELIAYARADEAAARTSTYHLVEVPDAAGTIAALDAALGVTVVVAKRRRLLLWDNVRIHLDDVEGLGRWIELEAVAGVGGSESDLAAEHDKVARLRDALELTDDRIVDLARRAMQRAYVPYSHFQVGAALRDEAGALHSGANVENGAYPQGQCAEASAIGALVRAGGTAIREVAVMADTELITPCGGCRQRLSEFAGPDVPVHLCGPEGIRRTTTMGELLPYAFDLLYAQR
jgi:homotetrameric cytidine deaminase